MAYNPLFKMSIQDADNNYYYATLNDDCSWTIGTNPYVTYIEVLPEGWENTSVTWARDTYYMGIFRSMSSNGSYSFSMDGRAIIEHIRNQGGVQGFGTLTIWMFNAGATTWEYQIFYQSQLDFKTYKDNYQTQLLEISTLDSKLIRDIHARADSKVNVPMWRNANPDPYSEPEWVLNDSFCVLHDGIKVLYNATYQSIANSQTGVNLNYFSSDELLGFNHGEPPASAHTIPVLTQYNIVQNNGTTTFIGNTILQKFIIQGNQVPGALHLVNETAFWGVNNSQPYTRNNFTIKNLLPNDSGTIDVNIQVTGRFAPTNFPTAGNWIGCGATAPAGDVFIGFVLFEIDNTDFPPFVAGNIVYQTIYKYYIPVAAPFTNYTPTNPSFDSGLVPFTLNYNKAYVFCIIYDGETTPIGLGAGLSCSFDQLQLSVLSKYDSGASGTPITAASFPPSVTLAFRPNKLLEKLVPYLASTTTNQYGFPIPAVTDYTGVSTYLADPHATPVGDAIPYQAVWTSGYCLHNLEGQSYITVSLNELFDFYNKVFGVGAYVLGSTFFMEKLSDIFNSSVMILDLGYDVAEMELTQLTEGINSCLEMGYTHADLNSNFGVDSFMTELFFNTPATNIPGTMDYKSTSVVVDQYQIELLRSQRTSQPIGSSINPANPSSDNPNIVLYCQPSPSPFVLPYTPVYPETCQLYDPSNNAVAVQPYQLTMRDGIIYPGVPCAQSTDPSATLAPYISNMFYPDRAFNVELSPCRILKRDKGALLHSVLDKMDSEYLTFRNTYVMQYNNTTLGEPSIQSNLEIGSGMAGLVTEFSDKLIGDLPAKLFQPVIAKVKSKYPINMYQILNTNPNGYIRWFWRQNGYSVKEYRMFITKAVQSAGTGMATEFYGWLTPDTVL